MPIEKFRTLSREEILQRLSIAGGIFLETGKMSHEAAKDAAEKIFDTKKIAVVFIKSGVLVIAYEELSGQNDQPIPPTITATPATPENIGDPREVNW